MARADIQKIEADALSYAALSCLGAVKQAHRMFRAQGKTDEDFDACAWEAMQKAVRHAVRLTAREVLDPVWPYAIDDAPGTQGGATPPPEPAPHFDVEAMLAACMPGGSICDPQQVADAIRGYFAPGVRSRDPLGEPGVDDGGPYNGLPPGVPEVSRG